MHLAHPGRKQKLIHELREMLGLFLYLALFFCAMAAYKMFLLNEYNVKSWDFGFALINALVVTKVIMIGEYAKVGRRYEHLPLLASALWKAFVFGLLVSAFHVVEEGIKLRMHGSNLARASHEIRFDELAARGIAGICIFIPLFAFRELRRAIGEVEFRRLFLGSKI